MPTGLLTEVTHEQIMRRELWQLNIESVDTTFFDLNERSIAYMSSSVTIKQPDRFKKYIKR